MRHAHIAFRSDKLDHAAREILRAEDVLSASSALRRIATVGLIVNSDHKIYQSDVRKLKTLASYFRQNNLQLNDAVEIHAYNLLPPMSNDFLHAAFRQKQENQADLVMLCGLPFYGGNEVMRRQAPFGEDLEREVLNEYINTYNLIAVNASHSAQGIWAEAASETGARYVATFGGTGDEIGTEAFADDPRWNIIKPSQNRGCLHQSDINALGVVQAAQP